MVFHENPSLIRYFSFFDMALYISLLLSLLPVLAAQSIQPSNDSLAPQASQLLLTYSSTGGMTAQAGVQPLTVEIGADQTLTMLNVSMEVALLSGARQRANTSSDHTHQRNHQIGGSARYGLDIRSNERQHCICQLRSKWKQLHDISDRCCESNYR